MALPLNDFSQKLEKNPSTVVQLTSANPKRGSRRGRGGEGEEDDMHPLSSFLPQANAEDGGLHDLLSARMWRNHVLWRAGVGNLENQLRNSVNQFIFLSLF